MKTRVLYLLITLLLSGCGGLIDAAVKTTEILMDPSIPVGEPKDRLSTISLSMNATLQVNPNPYNDNSSDVTESDVDGIDDLTGDVLEKTEESHDMVDASDSTASDIIVENSLSQQSLEPEATPISFKVIQLKDNSLLLQVDFESLSSDIEKALGSTYLAHDDFMLIPGEYKYIEPFEVEKRTRYIAVVAAFSDNANAKWKGSVKIKPKGRKYALFLNFDQKEIIIKKQE